MALTDWVFVVQCIVGAVMVATFFIYMGQLKAMQAQLNTMRESNKNQNFFDLVLYMREERRRLDRANLIKLGKTKKPFNKWTKPQVKCAERVCGSYNLIGIMVNENMVPLNLTLKGYRDSALKCFEAARPLLEKYQNERGKDFWGYFNSLIEKM